MFSDGSFELESILNTLNMVLLGVFIFILAILVIAFLRGLRRGWVYGTYRLVFFAILVIAAFVSLKAVGNMLADIDLNTFGIPSMLNLTEISQDVTVNGATVRISAPITSIRETGTSLLTQLLQAYGIEADPETLLGLVLAIVLSFVCIILLIVEALIIWIVGGLLCTLLWHLLFKHFLSPKNEEGKRVKKLRIISAFEEVIVSATILAMFISPLTSLVNTTSKAISRLPKDENHQTLVANDQFYSVLTSVVDTYENSLLSKTFFSWYTDPNTGLTFDAALIDFITTVNIDSTGEKKISLMREFKNVVDLAGSALTSGIFNAESVDTINYATLLTSDLIPTAIRVIGRSDLIQAILPFGLQFAINLPEVAEYVMTEDGIDFSHYEPAATFDDLADLWTSVTNSGLFDDIIDENGEFVDSDKMIDNVFKADYKSIFDSFFKIFSPDERKVLDDIIASALYVQAVKEYESPAAEGADDLTFGVKDLLPELTAEDLRRGANGYPVAIPDSIKSIDFGEELKVIFDSFYEIFTVDPSIAKIIWEPVFNPQGSSAPTGEEPFADTTAGKLLIAILENKDGVEHWIDGKEVEGASSDDLCLLDSNLIMNAVPKILESLEIGINQSFELVGDDEVDLSSIATSFRNKETPAAKKAAAKAEAQAIIDVLTPLVESEDGMALIKDPDGKPGLYFGEDGSFLGAKEGLLDAVADTVKKLDNSKVFSSVIPSVVEKVLAGGDSPLEGLLGNDIKIDAHCVDNAGNSIFGHELSKLVRALGECQDVIVLASGMDTSSSDMHAMEKLFTQMCDLETENHEKQLVKLFSAIATNKVINPVVEGKYNSNFYGLFKNIFEQMGIGSDDLNTTLENIICDENFDAENEVTAFVGLVEYICDKGLLGSISNLSLDSMANIKFGELFAKVDGSELLGSALGAIIDGSLHDNEIFTYINEGGETVALSFKNITNWTAEGEALDTMTKYAVQFGDLSNLDLESIDPDMMDSVLSYLAKSQLFVKTNADGTYDYNFPNYIASKLIEAFKGSGSMGTYFANLTETYDAVDGYKVVAAAGTANEDYSDFKASVLSHAVTGASSLTDIEAEQDVFIDEARLFGRIIRNVSNSGAFELMSSGSSADFSKFKVEYFRALLNDMSESVLFGKTAVPAVLKVVVDTLSTSVDTFKNTNIMYAYTCGETERLKIANSIADLLEVIVDPVSGLIGPSGEIDTGAFSNIEDLDPNHLISPLLKSLANNKVFTTLSDYQEDVAGITETALDNQMLFVLKQSAWYGSDERAEAVYPYIKEMVANRTGGWESEIDRFVEIVDDLHVMGIKLDSSFDFDSYFQEAGYGVDVLSDLFIDINESCLLFPGFPEKLNTALSTVEGSLASSGLNLDNANLYYLGKATVPATTYSYATKGYGEDECYNLASVIRYGSALSGGIDVTDLTAIPTGDIDNITELLGTFAKSHIFNSKKSATSDTVFQEFIAKILTTNEHVEDYIYDASSPKDMANASFYSDATNKAKYLAATYYPEVDPLSTTADSIATDNITGIGIPNSINTLLKRITADSDLLNDLEHSSLSDLVPSELASLLDVLNDCDWTYDAVPNAVALTIDQVSLDDVKFSRSNPYYAYYYDIAFDEGSGSFVKDPDAPRLLTPAFLNHYDNEEINRLAETIGLINGDPSALTEFSSKASITKVRDILNGLNESFIFSKDGACYLLEPDDSPAETKTDLSVFEQAMYKVFKDSTLASLSYNETIDSSYSDSEAKLLSKIKNFPSDKWDDELAAMLINDAQDSGLLCKAFDLGLISGSSVSVDANTLESLSPSEIAEILYAVNDVDMIRDIIPLQASEFLTNKLHFNNYSGAKVTYTPNAMSFALPVSTPVNSLTITYSGANAPVVSYLKAGALYSVTPNTISSGVNEYIINDGSSMTDIVLGHMISVTCDGNMSKVEVAFDTNAIIGMNKARLDTYDAVADIHKGAINSFIGLIEKLYNGTGYIDIGSDPSAIANLFNTSGNLTALSNFAKNGDSIYTRVYNANNEEAMSGVYTGGDIVLSNLLSFENGGATVNLARYLPNYDENDMTSVYKDLYTIFVGSNPNSLTSEEIASVTAWLDQNVLDVAFFYGAYEGGKIGGGMRNVSIGADSVVSTRSSKTIAQYIALDTGHVWNSFEAKFKAGFGRVFYEDMKDYAVSKNYFNGNNFSSINFRPNANNYESFIEMMRTGILPLLKDIKPSLMGGITNKPQIVEIFEAYSQNSHSPYSDVAVAFYEGTIYEFLNMNDATHFGTQPGIYPNPFGASGYFANAASILAA